MVCCFRSYVIVYCILGFHLMAFILLLGCCFGWLIRGLASLTCSLLGFLRIAPSIYVLLAYATFLPVILCLAWSY
jgi:hypothetical protein